MSRKMIRMGSLAIIATSLAACASATAVPVGYSSSVPGFRIYDVKPILIVNGQSVTVELIPNYNKAYAVQFSAFLAKQDYTIDFEKGMLKKLEGKQDTTAIIPLLQDIVKTFNPLNQPAKALSSSTEGGIENAFQVYEFIFDESGTLVGLRPLIEKNSLLKIRTSKGVVIAPAAQPNISPQPPASPGGSTPKPGVISQ